MTMITAAFLNFGVFPVSFKNILLTSNLIGGLICFAFFVCISLELLMTSGVYFYPIEVLESIFTKKNLMCSILCLHIENMYYKI